MKSIIYLLVSTIVMVTVSACTRDSLGPTTHDTEVAVYSGVITTVTTATAMPQIATSPLSPVAVVTTTNPAVIPTAMPPLVTNWSRYTSPLGFSIEYPNGWHLEVEEAWSAERFFSFWIAPTVDNDVPTAITIEAHLHPKVVNGLAIPYNSVPNEGGYDFYWPEPLSIDNANGLLFVWGKKNYATSSGSKWDVPATLMATYYSQLLDMEVQIIGGDFDDESTALTQRVGLEEVVRQHFPVFDHIIRSVRLFDPATVPGASQSSLLPELITTMPAALPVANQAPVMEWARYTNPLGFTMQYPANWQIEVDKDASDERLFAFWIAPMADAQASETIHVQVLVHPELFASEPLAFDWRVETMGTEVRYHAPITIGNGKGFLSADARGADVGLLYASFYAPMLDTEILLYQWYTNPEGVTPIDATKNDFDQAVKDRFPVFYYVITNLHFLNPVQQ